MNPIEELRVGSRLTRVALGNLLGVSPRTIWNWENEIGEPSLSQGFRMAEIFDVPIEKVKKGSSQTPETIEVVA